ncbi:MAG: hypothetical protein Q8O41_09675 [Candidatus Methanoperedens sp.]|nr:hypothetical protein [Candidatus Methanoperedens sp.]
MNDEDTDTLRLLMWIEKLEQKISKLEREVIDIKNSLKKTVRDEMSEEIKNVNLRLTALETATRQPSTKIIK